MADARELLQKIRTGLKPLEEKILRHRYLEALQTGRVARESCGYSRANNTTSSQAICAV